MANIGQESRLASKLQRNLTQVFLPQEGFTFVVVFNGFDYLVKITDVTAGNSNFLVKIKPTELQSFAVPGLPHNKICLCVDTAVDLGILSEIVARIKELGCGIEIWSKADPLGADDASDAGVFSGASYLRFVRGAVDMLNVGQ